MNFTERSKIAILVSKIESALRAEHFNFWAGNRDNFIGKESLHFEKIHI